MKYIKEFQKYYSTRDEDEYKVGDYIKHLYGYGDGDGIILGLHHPNSDLYVVGYSDGSTFLIPDYDIARKMTPEEIEEYETKKDSYKYNL